MKKLYFLFIALSLFVFSPAFGQWSSNSYGIYYNSKNVGIGISSPRVKLQISNGSDVGRTVQNSGYLIIGSSYGMHLALDNNEIMAKANGNTGRTLYIQNEGYETFFGGNVRTNANVYGKTLIAKHPSHGNQWQFVAKSNGGFEIRKYDGSNLGFFQIDSDGSMTMGFPGRNHHIMGELCLDADGTQCPDYVFADDYQLPTLKELEDFITTNKHLPNVRSAKEIAEQGHVKTLETVYALLEKVEELTLYTIQQEKKIQQQEEKIQQLDAHMAQLRAKED